MKLWTYKIACVTRTNLKFCNCVLNLWVMQLKEYIDDTEDLINIKLVTVNEHLTFQVTVQLFEKDDNFMVVYRNRAMCRTSWYNLNCFWRQLPLWRLYLPLWLGSLEWTLRIQYLTTHLHSTGFWLQPEFSVGCYTFLSCFILGTRKSYLCKSDSRENWFVGADNWILWSIWYFIELSVIRIS